MTTKKPIIDFSVHDTITIRFIDDPPPFSPVTERTPWERDVCQICKHEKKAKK